MSERQYEPSTKRPTPREGNVELPERLEVGNAFIERVSRLEASLKLLERAHDALAREAVALRKRMTTLEWHHAAPKGASGLPREPEDHPNKGHAS